MPLPHWYEQASPEDRREYDAFGPWILEVASADQMPPAFREAWSVWSQADLFYKFPIDKDRRSARPGQVLYDRLVAIQGDRLGLLTLAGGQVLTRVVPLGDIVALRSAHILLRGEFTLFLKGGDEAGFAYNTVSRPLIEALMDHLRAWLRAQTPYSVNEAAPEAPVEDYGFQTLVRRHRERTPEARVAACYEPGVLFRLGRWRRRKTSGLLILTADRERIFLDSGPAPHKVSEAVYASRCTVFPHRSWEGQTLAAETLTVRAGGRDFVWRIPGSPRAPEGG